MRRTYIVELQWNEGWHAIVKDETRGYAQGFFDARREQPGPSLACRWRNSDGLVIDHAPAVDGVSIGVVAGFPTAEQYEQAGNEALERARLIREREARQAARRATRAARWTDGALAMVTHDETGGEL